MLVFVVFLVVAYYCTPCHYLCMETTNTETLAVTEAVDLVYRCSRLYRNWLRWQIADAIDRELADAGLTPKDITREWVLDTFRTADARVGKL